jgi:hypothetical protein
LTGGKQCPRLNSVAPRLFLDVARCAALVTLFCSSFAASDEASEKRPASSRLNYTLGKGAEECPDQASVAAEVRSRLGYDPFGEPAGLILSASIRRVGESLIGALKIASTEGTPLGSKSFQASASDCAELAAEIELAICLAIDPLQGRGVERPLPAPTPPPVPPSPSTPPVAAATAVAPEQRSSVHARVYLGPVISFWAAPQAAPGIMLGGAIPIGPILLGLEGRADLATRLSYQTGSVSASLLAVLVTPCLMAGNFGGCAVLLVGSEESEAKDLPSAQKQGTPFFAAGGRAFFELPLGSVVFVKAQADVLAALSVISLRVPPVEVWKSPPVALTLGVGVGAYFP